MDPALETWDPRPVNYRYTPRMREINVADVLAKAELALQARISPRPR